MSVFVRQAEHNYRKLPSWLCNDCILSEYFHIGYVGRVNVFTNYLDLSFDGNVPTLQNHSPDWVEIEGTCIGCVLYVV